MGMSIGYFKKKCMFGWMVPFTSKMEWQRRSVGVPSGAVSSRNILVGSGSPQQEVSYNITTFKTARIPCRRSLLCLRVPDTNNYDSNWAFVIETVNLIGSNAKPNYADACSISNLFVCPDFDTNIASIIETNNLFGSSVGSTTTEPTASPTMLTLASPTSTNNQMIEQGREAKLNEAEDKSGSAPNNGPEAKGGCCVIS